MRVHFRPMDQDAEESEKFRHPIQVAARRSGLSVDVIRVWERRYRAVQPMRAGSRRLYSDADIARLILLRKATSAGRRIGDVANLADEVLAHLVREDDAVGATSARQAPANAHLAAALDAVADLDAAGLRQALNAAVAGLSRPVLFDEVMMPLMREVGRRWHHGELSICHEHLATAQVVALLGTMLSSTNLAERGPTLVVTTPVGQRHEIGALLAALTAASEGWRVLYLGPNTPASEVAASVLQADAQAIALSLLYPPDDPQVSEELRQLRGLLPAGFPIFVGGGAAPAYQAALAETGALLIGDLDHLREQLQKVRQGS